MLTTNTERRRGRPSGGGGGMPGGTRRERQETARRADPEAVRQLATCRDLFTAALQSARCDIGMGCAARFDDSIISACLRLSMADQRALLGLLGEARDLLLETSTRRELLDA